VLLVKFDRGIRQLSDEELVALIRVAEASRDQRQLEEELFARYLGLIDARVSTELRRSLGPEATQALTDECVSTACLKLLREVRDRERELPEPFVVAVLARRSFAARDRVPQLRADTAHLRALDELNEPAGMDAPRAARGSQEDEAMTHAESERQFEDLIAPLPDQQRAIVYARLHDDLSYEEIAAIHEKEPSAIRQAYSRAIRRLAPGVTGVAVAAELARRPAGGRVTRLWLTRRAPRRKTYARARAFIAANPPESHTH
jgi:RNA polymerase sigma factor (sigma-70 family)